MYTTNVRYLLYFQRLSFGRAHLLHFKKTFIGNLVLNQFLDDLLLGQGFVLSKAAPSCDLLKVSPQHKGLKKN